MSCVIPWFSLRTQSSSRITDDAFKQTSTCVPLTQDFGNDPEPVVPTLATGFAVREGAQRAAVAAVARVACHTWLALALARAPVALQSFRAGRVTHTFCGGERKRNGMDLPLAPSSQRSTRAHLGSPAGSPACPSKTSCTRCNLAHLGPSYTCTSLCSARENFITCPATLLFKKVSNVGLSRN